MLFATRSVYQLFDRYPQVNVLVLLVLGQSIWGVAFSLGPGVKWIRPHAWVLCKMNADARWQFSKYFKRYYFSSIDAVCVLVHLETDVQFHYVVYNDKKNL